jgi:hypothetical protein
MHNPGGSEHAGDEQSSGCPVACPYAALAATSLLPQTRLHHNCIAAWRCNEHRTHKSACAEQQQRGKDVLCMPTPIPAALPAAAVVQHAGVGAEEWFSRAGGA